MFLISLYHVQLWATLYALKMSRATSWSRSIYAKTPISEIQSDRKIVKQVLYLKIC